MQGRQRANRDEFRVVVSGVELSDADRERINLAVQQAALSAIADLDFGGDRAAFVLPISPKFPGRLPDWWGDLGHTQGIWIGPVLTDELERLIR